MRIALSMRITNAIGYHEPRDSISHDWIEWSKRMGYIACPIPNSLDDPGAYMSALNINALVLTGGNNIVRSAHKNDDTAPQRDNTEFSLLATAIATGVPVFAVCRGLHVVNSYFGGEVIADISHTPVNHVAVDHTVHLSAPFARMANESEIQTNSFHNQAVALDGVAKDLSIIATSKADSLAEGLVHRKLPILAVQWHPERPNPSAVFDSILFDRLLSEGPFWQNTL